MDKIKKQSKIISVRLPTDLIIAVSFLSDKSKYLTMSNVIKLGVMSVRICVVLRIVSYSFINNLSEN